MTISNNEAPESSISHYFSCRILVDGTPVRAFRNHAARGVPFPTWQRMRLQGTLWNADEWATQGGRIKTDWTQAPFYAYYRNLRVTPCAPSPGVAWCGDEPLESAWFERRSRRRRRST